ncbi:hypothetical protein Ddc_22435 [Ditylenchus destructor]|nr:hypothetical protein Ddc_22435 [Ditylenchus destructor]
MARLLPGQGVHEAVLGGARHVFLDGTDRDAQGGRDLGVAGAFQLRHQEGPSHLVAQAMQHGVDLADGFQQDGLRLGRNGAGFGLLRQRFQPGAFQHLAADMVDQGALGHRGQETARLADALQLRHGRGRGQQPHERVLRQVGGFRGDAQAPQQPPAQPAMMIAIEPAKLAVLQGFRGRHGRSVNASRFLGMGIVIIIDGDGQSHSSAL